MRWHDVLWIVKNEVRANADLQSVYGTVMRQGGTHALTVPSLEWHLISDSASELWEPCTVQLDQWVETVDDLVISEAALRSLFDQALPVVFTNPSGGDNLVTWCVFVDGASLVSPDRAGFHGRAIRFRFTPLRDCLRDRS